LVKCLKCGNEYKVDELVREVVEPGTGKTIKEKFYRVHCTKCGHVLRVKRTKDEENRLYAMGIDNPEGILTEEEFFKFQTRQAEAGYLFGKGTKRLAKGMRKRLKEMGLPKEEERIEKERLTKEKAIQNLIRKAGMKLREAKDLPEDEWNKLREKTLKDVKKIRSGEYDPEELEAEIKAISDEIDKAEAREEKLKELERVTKRKEKELEKEREKARVIGHKEDYFTKKLADENKIGFSAGFGNAHWTEQRDALMDFYNQEMENLRSAYQKGDIDHKEFRKHAGDLKDYVNQKMGRRGRWTWRSKKMYEHHYSKQLKNVALVLALAIVGVVVASTTGSNYFLIAFLSVAVYLMVPDPKNIEFQKDVKLGSNEWIKSFNPLGKSYSHHNGNSFLRSLAKVSAIVFFSFGFKDLGDVFNIFYIGIAIFGYFLLKVDYDPDVPAEFIESVFRFFIGIVFIPQIFVNIFDSWVLGAIALAFFAVPPLPAAENKNIAAVLSRGLSGATAIYEILDKVVFAFLMLFALIGSGVLPIPFAGEVGWELSGVLQDTFLYFWIVTLIAGLFSPAKERPVTGAIMLGVATIIYGIGPGSQAIGSGLLGQWWPTVHNTFTSVTEPMANVMGSLGDTFGQGFMLLTNPVGYATQLMNGTYAQNPTGQTGSFGVDINEFTITNIFPEQPFVVTAIMENKGASDAENVKISLAAISSDRFATEGKERTGLLRSTERFDIVQLGFKSKDDKGSCDKISEKEAFSQTSKECIQYYSGIKTNKLSKLMVWQAAFQSTGIPCSTIIGKDLRKKFIPIMATVTYEYKSDSRVEVEFISKAEWERLAQAGQLDQRFRFVDSQYSSAPVKFPIGTAGLKNPILEDQQFHISMMLDSAFESGSQIDNVESVYLRYPKDWKLKYCSPPLDAPHELIEGSTDMTVKWVNLGGGAKTLVCYFYSLTNDANKDKSPMGGAPSRTYVVTANATYTFSRSKIKDTKIEFGGFCCVDKPETGYSEDCLESQKCVNHACVAKDLTVPSIGEENFCALLKQGKVPGVDYRLCWYGEGGCETSGDCDQAFRYDCNNDENVHDLECVPVSGVPYKICCSEEFSDAECKNIHDYWLQKHARISSGDELCRAARGS
jgi:hypothetical protein